MAKPDPKPEKKTSPKLRKRKCLVCGNWFQKTKPIQSVCSIPCAIDHAKKLEEKKKDKEWKNKKKKGLQELKKYSQKLQAARKVFQKYIRIRDQDKPCISCGSIKAQIWDGGHYLKAELYSGYIFHPLNCNKQCRKCNHFESGNEILYREGLINRIGLDKVIKLESDKNNYRGRKYTDFELDKIKEVYGKKIKALIKLRKM